MKTKKDYHAVMARFYSRRNAIASLRDCQRKVYLLSAKFKETLIKEQSQWLHNFLSLPPETVLGQCSKQALEELVDFLLSNDPHGQYDADFGAC